MKTQQVLSNVDFSFIRYANSWEDGDVLLRSLAEDKTEDILSIAAGGDNTLALATCTTKSIHAIDINKCQLYLTELKMLAFSKLAYEEVLIFLGVSEGTIAERETYFDRLRDGLSTEAKSYWLSHKTLIRKGLIHSGKFEHYFKIFRNYCLPLAHGPARIEQLFTPKTAEAQRTFYENKWNNRMWNLMMKLFYSKAVMGKMGRDPEFLKHVHLSVSEYIRQKTAAALMSGDCSNNYFLHYILSGNFGQHLPYYLRRENFANIKNNLYKIELSQEDIYKAVSQKSYDSYYCSNVFEYLSAEEFAQVSESWSAYIPKGSKLVFWNLMNLRSFSEQNPEYFSCNKSLSEQLSAIDKGFFYNRFLSEKRI